MDAAKQTEQIAYETLLVQRAQTGDKAAFELLAERCRPLLLAQAFLRTNHREEAQDLAQEVLAKAWQQLQTLQDPARFLPWIKTITANACASWHRRRTSRPAVINNEGLEKQMATQGLPLEMVLKREQQRELWEALQTLPHANRLALLMHVWGEASYDDIAVAAGVPITTIEGRIFRAKQQLRRLLHDEGTETLGLLPPKRHLGYETPSRPRQRRTNMTTPPLPTTYNDWTSLSTLTLFTRRFSTMVDTGISLVHTLEALQDTPSPYGEIAAEMKAKVENGAVLSETMAAHPDQFSAPYIGMIRMGEIGGILEETLQRITKVVAKEWYLARHHPNNEAPFLLLHPAAAPSLQDWAAMSSYQRAVTLILFFETFGMLLQSGIPILQTMEIIAELLPSALRGEWEQVRQEVTQGRSIVPRMKRLGIFPHFALAMVQVGEEEGSLDATLHRLAMTLEEELGDTVLQS